MHRKVNDKSAILRWKKRSQKDASRPLPNFEVGDFVLIGLPQSKPADQKLALKWRGPYKITDTENNNVFEIENIIDKQKQIVHMTECAIMMMVYWILPMISKHDFLMTIAQNEVKEFKGCRMNPNIGGIQFLVEWKVFSTEDDTWEGVGNLYVNIPVEVKKYLRKFTSDKYSLSEEVTQFIRRVDCWESSFFPPGFLMR
jgi:hypothetical protein